MSSVTVSPKYQVVIPRNVRDHLKIKPGQKIQFVTFGKTVHLVPVVPIEQLKGFAKGIDTTIVRDPDREL